MSRGLVRDERGIAMVLVVLVGSVATLLAIVLIDTVLAETNRSSRQVLSGSSYQAAEAGVDDYTSKLVDDRMYYVHYVHPGESTRREPGGTDVSSGGTQAPWTYGATWSYPGGRDAWRALPNGYEYNLRIYPPTASTPYVRIVAAGRRAGSTSDVRVVEAYVRPSSLADYYRVVDGNVSWGSAATTDGKVYASGNISHAGVATGDILAEGQISGSVSMQGGARRYDVDSNPDIRSKMKTPLDFSSFLASFTDIQRASQLPGGIYLDNAANAAWRLTFNAGGSVTVEACQQSGSSNVADAPPSCSGATTYPVPPNGAVYSEQDVIVSGTVKGRVTVASNNDIVVGNNIAYVSVDQDVLGLVAKNDLWVARYVPSVFSWSAGVIAQNGTWRARSWSGALKTSMTFTGMSATADGGSFAGMFAERFYGYDDSFLFLPPPWFPIVEDAYTVVLVRELPSGT